MKTLLKFDLKCLSTFIYLNNEETPSFVSENVKFNPSAIKAISNIVESTHRAVESIPGVLSYFGKDAKEFRSIVRGMEDVLEENGFDQFWIGGLVSKDIFLQNLDFLGERFEENLVKVDVNGDDKSILPPEGTMIAYNLIKKLELDKAKIFYSSNFTRNEDPKEVEMGKTRNFHQTGFEIFNYPEEEASIEAIKTTAEAILSTGLDGFVIRLSDKRMINGLLNNAMNQDRENVLSIMDKADDDPQKLRELYKENGGNNESFISKIANFLELANGDLQAEELEKFTKNSPLFQEGLLNVKNIYNFFQENEDVKNGKFSLKVLPFMAKSWDACPKLLLDARYPGYDAAIAGGGNLYYPGYKVDLPKSGAGIGVTRIYDILKKNKELDDSSINNT